MSPPLPTLRQLAVSYQHPRELLDRALAGIPDPLGDDDVEDLQAQLVEIADEMVARVLEMEATDAVPRLVESMKRVLSYYQGRSVTVDRIMASLSAHGWLPDMRDVRGYVYYLLATKTDVFVSEPPSGGGPKLWRLKSAVAPPPPSVWDRINEEP